jgi:hypothetical protein
MACPYQKCCLQLANNSQSNHGILTYAITIARVCSQTVSDMLHVCGRTKLRITGGVLWIREPEIRVPSVLEKPASGRRE